MLKKASFMSRLPMQETTDFSLWRNAILSIQKTNKPRTLVCGKPKVFLIIIFYLYSQTMAQQSLQMKIFL